MRSENRPGVEKVPMMRMKPEQYQKLEILAVAQAMKEGRPVAASEKLHRMIDQAFDALSEDEKKKIGQQD